MPLSSVGIKRRSLSSDGDAFTLIGQGALISSTDIYDPIAEATSGMAGDDFECLEPAAILEVRRQTGVLIALLLLKGYPTSSMAQRTCN